MAECNGMVGADMEIITLLKGNIRGRKGSFISIMLLMVIISMALTTVLSVRDNCSKSYENALEQVHAGDLTVIIKNENLTDDLLEKTENHSMVKEVLHIPVLCSDKTEFAGKTNGNSTFLRKIDATYKLINQEKNTYEETIPALEHGEIYITQGIVTNMDCHIGDTLKFFVGGEEKAFRIKGIVAEPVMGASVIGWKQAFISDEDFDNLYNAFSRKEKSDISPFCQVVQIYKADNCELSDGQWKRQLNLDTGIVNNASGSLTKSMSRHYTNLFPEVIVSILMIFIGLLLVIVLVVMGHSISTGIEMDYVNLGILKSQGFTQEKIRLVFVLQYMLAELAGAAVGILLSVPLINSLGNVFLPIMAVVAQNSISAGKSAAVLLGIFIISGLFIVVITGKIGKISPVRAITGGRREIYFDSRINVPVYKKGLSLWLAFRQFTAGKKRYAGAILIVSILVFFMMTIMILGNVLNSKSSIEAMTGIYTECDAVFKKAPDEQLFQAMEQKIQEYSPIKKKYYLTTTYLSINGDEIYCQIYKEPDIIVADKGRAPLYDNEIVITEIVADELNLHMGDEVVVAHNNKEDKYIVSGIFQSINDTGMTFAMSLAGAEKLGIDKIYYAGYSFEQPNQCEEIACMMNEEFSDYLEAEAAPNGGGLEDTYVVAINAMKFIIYTISVVFALVVVMMFCTKTFMQEKTDMGIYKALGFTTFNLRLQFALRFLIIALAGSILGAAVSILCSGRLLSSILRLIGVTRFVVNYTADTFFIPVSLICVCFFLFALLVSGKMKRVAVRELVTE